MIETKKDKKKAIELAPIFFILKWALRKEQR